MVNVKFIPVYSVNYAIFIKQGERTYQQEITNLTANRSNTIELKTPYTIDANQGSGSFPSMPENTDARFILLS